MVTRHKTSNRRYIKLATLFFVGLCANCAYTIRYYPVEVKAAPFVISDKVGNEIDSLERKRYGLFVNVAGFESAEFYEIADGGYMVELSTSGGKMTAVNRDPHAREIMRSYIDEEINQKSKQEFEKRWGIIGYDVLGQPITRAELNNCKIFRNKNMIRYVNIGLFTCGCAGFALFPCGYIAVAATWYNMETAKATIIMIAGETVAAAVGLLIGNKVDDRKILQAIKNARKPVRANK